MLYTIAGVRYETAAGVIDAFAPDGDPCTSREQVYDVVDGLSDIAASQDVIFTDADLTALMDAFTEYYGIEG